MDLTPFILSAPVVSLGITAVLFLILHGFAVRRGGSIMRDLGARGWVVALLVVFASSLFSAVVVNALVAPYNVPVDWTPLLIEGPILAALGAGVFFLAWRVLASSLPARPTPVAQKG